MLIQIQEFPIWSLLKFEPAPTRPFLMLLPQIIFSSEQYNQTLDNLFFIQRSFELNFYYKSLPELTASNHRYFLWLLYKFSLDKLSAFLKFHYSLSKHSLKDPQMVSHIVKP